MKVLGQRRKFLLNIKFRNVIMIRARIRRPSIRQVIILSMILNKLLNYNKKLFLQTI